MAVQGRARIAQKFVVVDETEADSRALELGSMRSSSPSSEVPRSLSSRLSSRLFWQESVFDPTREWGVKAVIGHAGRDKWQVRWQGKWEDTSEPIEHLRPDGLRALARYVAAARALAQVDDPVRLLLFTGFDQCDRTLSVSC